MTNEEMAKEIALMAIDSDSMRGDIQDALELTDEEMMDLYRYLSQ